MDGCPPGIGIGLLQFPRDRQDDPRAQSYVIDHVAPGTTFTRRFQVCNGTSGRITAQLYAAAADVRDGAFSLADARQGNDLSRAITVDPPTLTLDAGRAGAASATFRIPRDAQEGEQYAVIYAELAGPPGGPVKTTSRAGIRVYLSIGRGGEPASDFVIDSLQAVRQPDGTPAVLAEVTNTGARALDLRGELRLTDGPGGLAGGPFPADVGTTLGIGDTAPVTVPLDPAIRGGPWTATLTLRSGLLERQARAQITFPDEAGAEAEPVVAETLSPGEDPKILVPIAGSLILLIILALLWWLIVRRRSKEDDQEEDEELVPAG